MTINEYLQGCREIKAAQEDLLRKDAALREDFAKSLSGDGLIGCKVKCYRGDKYVGDALLDGIDGDGDFVLKLERRDGSISRVSAGYWGVDRIERA